MLQHHIIYKFYFKVLIERLNSVLPDLINNKQNDFFQGRNISKNILFIYDAVKGYHKSGGNKPGCAIKVDLMKAYDTIGWDYLFEVLKPMKFPNRFITWIRNGVRTASFSLNLNGLVVGYFESERCTGQGDSISPYLFPLAMEVMSLLLENIALPLQVLCKVSILDNLIHYVCR